MEAKTQPGWMMRNINPEIREVRKETERWVIYEYASLDADDGDEVSWHKTFEKAQEVANANHAKTGLPYRIDLCWGSGGVARWECEGSEADVYWVRSE